MSSIFLAWLYSAWLPGGTYRARRSHWKNRVLSKCFMSLLEHPGRHREEGERSNYRGLCWRRRRRRMWAGGGAGGELKEGVSDATAFFVSLVMWYCSWVFCVAGRLGSWRWDDRMLRRWEGESWCWDDKVLRRWEGESWCWDDRMLREWKVRSWCWDYKMLRGWEGENWCWDERVGRWELVRVDRMLRRWKVRSLCWDNRMLGR